MSAPLQKAAAQAFRKYALAAAFILLLAVASLLPRHWKRRFATHGSLHALLHVAAFGIAFLLSTRARNSRRAAALLLFGVGLLLEILETRGYGFLFEYGDVAADAIGIALGWCIRALISS